LKGCLQKPEWGDARLEDRPTDSQPSDGVSRYMTWSSLSHGEWRVGVPMVQRPRAHPSGALTDYVGWGHWVSPYEKCHCGLGLWVNADIDLGRYCCSMCPHSGGEVHAEDCSMHF
jgi:hypothetical protein